MATYEDILDKIQQSIKKFNKGIPPHQQSILEGISSELSGLDLKDGNIKATVANLRLIARVKNKLNKLILTDDYQREVKDFAKSFNEVTKLQNAYWKGLEKTFKPRPLLEEIKTQAISDTVDHLTASGIGANISTRITEILRANITTGGSMKALTKQLKVSLTNAGGTDGLLTKYARQITTDSINQYNAQYTQVVSSDLGFEWFAYQGTDIKTTRPFCDAMTDLRYFHVSEIPRLLRAEDLYYQKDGKQKKVPIYDRTGLPNGMIEGTNAANFQIRRGGYNCGHQIRPVSESLVKASAPEVYARVIGTPGYQNWKSKPGGSPETPPIEPKKFVPTRSREEIMEALRRQHAKPEPVKLSGKEIRAKLEASNKESLKTLEKAGYETHADLLEYFSDAVIKIEVGSKKGAFYDPRTKQVVIPGTGDRLKNPGFLDRVVAHELAHALHFDQKIIGYGQVSPEFKTMFDGLKKTIRGKGLEVENALGQHNKAQRDKDPKAWDSESALAMADVLGSLTRGSYGHGHTKAYYKTPAMSEMEIFAHAMEFYKKDNATRHAHPILKEIHDTMKEYMSNTLKAIKK